MPWDGVSSHGEQHLRSLKARILSTRSGNEVYPQRSQVSTFACQALCTSLPSPPSSTLSARTYPARNSQRQPLPPGFAQRRRVEPAAEMEGGVCRKRRVGSFSSAHSQEYSCGSRSIRSTRRGVFDFIWRAVEWHQGWVNPSRLLTFPGAYPPVGLARAILTRGDVSSSTREAHDGNGGCGGV